jgi:hypothetical protein
LPRRPWTLAAVAAVVSIVVSVAWLTIIDLNIGGEAAVIGVAVTGTAATILTLLAFADGLGAEPRSRAAVDEATQRSPTPLG